MLLSNRKRRMMNEKIDKIVKSQGPDARETIARKRDHRRRGSGDGEEGEVYDDDIFAAEPVDLEKAVGVGEREWRLPPRRREEEVRREKPKDLRQLLKRDAGNEKLDAPIPVSNFQTLLPCPAT
jgi:hypothetical protein